MAALLRPGIPPVPLESARYPRDVAHVISRPGIKLTWLRRLASAGLSWRVKALEIVFLMNLATRYRARLDRASRRSFALWRDADRATVDRVISSQAPWRFADQERTHRGGTYEFAGAASSGRPGNPTRTARMTRASRSSGGCRGGRVEVLPGRREP